MPLITATGDAEMNENHIPEMDCGNDFECWWEAIGRFEAAERDEAEIDSANAELQMAAEDMIHD